jgi:anti-sigma regulatory factor (Ser/Thr protein kinase)
MWPLERSAVKLAAGKPSSAAGRAGRSGKKTSAERLELPVHLGSGRTLRDALARLYREYAIDADAGDDFILAVSEAFSNAVRHGTGEDGSRVEAEIRMSVASCQVTLHYPGEPFPLKPPKLPNGAATNGRGRYLMSVLADAVEYEFGDGMTRVTLVKRWR